LVLAQACFAADYVQGALSALNNGDTVHTKLAAKMKEAFVIRNDGKSKFEKGDYEAAGKLFRSALSIMEQIESEQLWAPGDPNAKLHGNLASVAMAMGSFVDAIRECNYALFYNPQYDKVKDRRARLFVELEEFSSALRDVRVIPEGSATVDLKDLIAKSEQRTYTVLGANHKKILGVKDNSTVKEIEKAFKKLAILHHPDKNKEIPEEATALFNLIQKARDETLEEARERERLQQIEVERERQQEQVRQRVEQQARENEPNTSPAARETNPSAPSPRRTEEDGRRAQGTSNMQTDRARWESNRTPTSSKKNHTKIPEPMPSRPKSTETKKYKIPEVLSEERIKAMEKRMGAGAFDTKFYI